MVSVGEDEFGVLGGPDTVLVTRSTGVPLNGLDLDLLADEKEMGFSSRHAHA